MGSVHSWNRASSEKHCGRHDQTTFTSNTGGSDDAFLLFPPRRSSCVTSPTIVLLKSWTRGAPSATPWPWLVFVSDRYPLHPHGHPKQTKDAHSKTDENRRQTVSPCSTPTHSCRPACAYEMRRMFLERSKQNPRVRNTDDGGSVRADHHGQLRVAGPEEVPQNHPEAQTSPGAKAKLARLRAA